MTTPDACPICGTAASHDAPKVGTFQGRIYQCGAIVVSLDEGEWEVSLYCEKTGDILDSLRAENARLGDMNVLLATELQAIADAAEAELGPWLPVSITYLPETLHAMRTVYDLAIEALEGQPTTPAAEAPDEPGQGSQALSVPAVSGPSETSCPTP